MKSKPKIIYVVTSGEYSDYTIHGVFSTRPKAKKFLPSLEEEGYAEPRIEEYELDGLVGAVLRKSWWATIRLGDGGMFHTTSVDILAKKNDKSHLPVISQCGRYLTAISFVSEKHAIKLAVEARQKELRRGLHVTTT